MRNRNEIRDGDGDGDGDGDRSVEETRFAGVQISTACFKKEQKRNGELYGSAVVPSMPDGLQYLRTQLHLEYSRVGSCMAQKDRYCGIPR